MASKSTSSKLPPAPLRSHSQRQLALSDPGCAIRPMIDPTATARCRPLNPSPSSNPLRPSLSIAHNPTCSTPTVRGRANSSDSTSTVCRSVPPAATSGPPVHQLHGYPLCFPFNLFRTLQLYQHPLPLQQLLDPTAQHRPMLRCHRKVHCRD